MQKINNDILPTTSVPQNQPKPSKPFYVETTKNFSRKIPEDSLISILTDTIGKIENSDDIKVTITLALTP